MKTIFYVWKQQGTGYVSLPRKKDGKWEEKSFKWPAQLDQIQKWIKDSVKNQMDIYWCPNVLKGNRRVEDNVRSMKVLYADMDEANPGNLPGDLQPSMAWETSPGRYAALWLLDEKIGATTGLILNKRLTYYINADKSGWDATQVLRIPGTRNYKYKDSPKGSLLWYKGNRIFSEEYFEFLPEVTVSDDVDAMDMEETGDVDQILYKYADKLLSKTYKLLFTPPDHVEEGTRSEKLWELECLLLESGMSVDEAYTLVKQSPWNKFQGRRDEEIRLKREITKALTQVEIVDTNPRKLMTYGQLMSKKMDSPKWLIEGWWEAQSHGIIAGEPKTYKSTISTEIAISVSSGRPLFNRYPVDTPGPVVIIQEENSDWLMQDRFNKVANNKKLLGACSTDGTCLTFASPQDLPIHMFNREGFNLTRQEDRTLIEETLDEIKPVLLICDPIYLLLGEADENHMKDIREVLGWFIKVEKHYKTAIMLIHHFNKSGSSPRGGQRMLGSVGWHAWIESAIYNRVSEDKKNHITVEREFRSFMAPNNIEIGFKMGEPGELEYEIEIAEDILNDLNVIVNILRGNTGMSLKDIADTLSMSQSHVKTQLNRGITEGTIKYDGETKKYKVGE